MLNSFLLLCAASPLIFNYLQKIAAFSNCYIYISKSFESYNKRQIGIQIPTNRVENMRRMGILFRHFL